MADNLEALKEWIGKTEVAEERASVGRIHGLAALLDKPEVPEEGDPVGPMGHWCYFMPRVPASKIGADGHPARGGFMPPVPLPRRMFGGFRATYHKPLILGEMMQREARIANVQIKEGRTGTLVICTVHHEFSGENGLALEEDHDYVYRGNPPADSSDSTGGSGKTAMAPTDHAWRREITPNPVMLFRYSAVTFNGHRIHYDRKYVTEVEGYPALVVHGPLIATLLAELAIDNNPGREFRRFDFQARAPLFDNAPFTVAGKPTEDGCSLWSTTPGGSYSARATAVFA
ncbi:MAG: acyl-CoA dehydrogenase [Alphaproteobacteria bacterium]|nr:acyl-CoA dehydrogenase [Alphaproteobacteria bacterium]